MSDAHTKQPVARVVALGASNLTRGISTVVETAQRLLGSPLEMHFATGHGRSYGTDSFVLVRSLPSILDSSLWDVLAEAEPAPTYGLITDIGNDVMYGAEPATIADWVTRCVDRLQAHHANLVMTALPMPRLRRLSRANYLIARTLFFPTNRMTMEEAIERAAALDAMLRDMAANRSIPVVDFPDRWYGPDPIHVRRPYWAEAWGTVLAHWVDSANPPEVRAEGSFARWLRLRLSSPDKWWLLGRIPRGRKQPCLRLADGTSVFLR